MQLQPKVGQIAKVCPHNRLSEGVYYPMHKVEVRLCLDCKQMVSRTDIEKALRNL